MICPSCYGFGFTFAFFQARKIPCESCGGLGKRDVNIHWTQYGVEMRKWRIDHGMTLREACRRYNVDPSNVSKMERGLIKPMRYWK